MRRSQQLRSWAYRSQAAPRMRVIAEHAKPYLKVDISELDRQPLKLNLKNGTLVFAKTAGVWGVRLYPHDPKDLITKACSVRYDAKAICPTYDAALSLVQPDSTTSDISEQKVFFFYGAGRNGKSTFMETWARVLNDYATTIPIERFLQTRQSVDASKPSPDLARLHAVRLLRTSEPERNARLAESTIKLATSGERILTRHLNRAFFELSPQFKLFVSGNYKPIITGTDDGIWRRVVLVPWEVTISDEQCDPHLVDKLTAEGSGILNRMVQGTLSWLSRGLDMPEQIMGATADYRESSDHLGRFLSECVRHALGSAEPATRLYLVYAAWAKATGAPLWKQTGFGKAMGDRGYRSTKSGTHFWMDIHLIKSESDFEPSLPSSAASKPVARPDDDDDPF